MGVVGVVGVWGLGFGVGGLGVALHYIIFLLLLLLLILIFLQLFYLLDGQYALRFEVGIRQRRVNRSINMGSRLGVGGWG